MRTATAFAFGFAIGMLSLTAVLWSTGHLVLTSAQAAPMEPVSLPLPAPPPLPTPPPASRPPIRRPRLHRRRPRGSFRLAPPAVVEPKADTAMPNLAMPIAGVDPATLHSNFEETRNGRRHEALDIMTARGTPVHAVAEGNVVKLFDSKQGGLTVYQFDNTQHWCYYYAHLDRYAAGLKEGTLLRKGDVLGYAGSTGNASPEAPHLHFAVSELGPEKHWWEGTPIDPLPMLRSDEQGGKSGQSRTLIHGSGIHWGQRFRSLVYLRECCLLFSCAVLLEYESYEARQNQEGRCAQDEDAGVQDLCARALLRVRGAIAHHALAACQSRAQQPKEDQSSHAGGLMMGMRYASPRKISISTMQKISIGKSVRKRLRRSNFKCMK